MDFLTFQFFPSTDGRRSRRASLPERSDLRSTLSRILFRIFVLSGTDLSPHKVLRSPRLSSSGCNGARRTSSHPWPLQLADKHVQGHCGRQLLPQDGDAASEYHHFRLERHRDYGLRHSLRSWFPCQSDAGSLSAQWNKKVLVWQLHCQD